MEISLLLVVINLQYFLNQSIKIISKTDSNQVIQNEKN